MPIHSKCKKHTARGNVRHAVQVVGTVFAGRVPAEFEFISVNYCVASYSKECRPGDREVAGLGFESRLLDCSVRPWARRKWCYTNWIYYYY